MTGRPRVLLLAGSSEGSALARRIGATSGWDLVVSYAGRTRVRTQTPGVERVGGFGGIDGLVRYLLDERIDVLVDATHPFAAQMPQHAAVASERVGVPRLRVLRDPWAEQAGDHWHRVRDLAGAADAVGRLGACRVFLTTGRQELAPFARFEHAWFLVRAIEAPDTVPLADAAVVLDRGPFDLDGELALMRDHEIDLLVAKDSGGTAAAPKLDAARSLGVPVVMVDRPAGPDGPTVTTVDAAMAWLGAQLSPGPDTSGE